MSKVIRTGTIYRMVGFMVVAVLALAIAVPTIADMLISQVEQQDAEVAARPLATPPAAPVAAAKPVVTPQAPVVFGAPTMPAAPVDHTKLQQQQVQNPPSPSIQPVVPAKPSYTQKAPEPSADLGIDPQVTAPRVIPPTQKPKPAEKPRNWQKVKIE